MLERFVFMTDTQAIDVMTFDFKGTRVRCFSAALLIFKWITLKFKSFLNDLSLYGENLNEMRSSISNWQT